MGEYEQSGQLIQSYGYKPDSLFTTDPVFTHRPDFTEAKGYAYYINNHLSTPQKLITNTGRKVWEASADAFGKTIITNDDFRNPLRFPGQYEDNESTLYYNWFRFYDYQIGRYITSDPIGLNGGVNEFLYAYANSTVFFDYLGLLMCDYYAAEDYVKKIMKEKGFRLPKYYEIAQPPPLYANHSGYYNPDTDIAEINDEYAEYCLGYNEAKNLLNSYIHETLHANQSTVEKEMGKRGGADSETIHNEIYKRADLLTEEWMEEYEKRRKEECGGSEDCSYEWCNPAPKI